MAHLQGATPAARVNGPFPPAAARNAPSGPDSRHAAPWSGPAHRRRMETLHPPGPCRNAAGARPARLDRANRQCPGGWAFLYRNRPAITRVSSLGAPARAPCGNAPETAGLRPCTAGARRRPVEHRPRRDAACPSERLLPSSPSSRSPGSSPRPAPPSAAPGRGSRRGPVRGGRCPRTSPRPRPGRWARRRRPGPGPPR
jgi:hypothetical protein